MEDLKTKKGILKVKLRVAMRRKLTRDGWRMSDLLHGTATRSLLKQGRYAAEGGFGGRP